MLCHREDKNNKSSRENDFMFKLVIFHLYVLNAFINIINIKKTCHFVFYEKGFMF